MDRIVTTGVKKAERTAKPARVAKAKREANGTRRARKNLVILRAPVKLDRLPFQCPHVT